jgi:tetratricopeptide (TPR) repeat protein
MTGRLIASLICSVVRVAAQSGPDFGNHLELENQIKALYRQGEWAEAARVAESEPWDSPGKDFYFGLALARLGQLDKAAEVFKSAQEKYADDNRFSLELAGLAFRAHNRDAARRWLRTALRQDPASAYGNEFLGTLYLLDSNLPAAVKYLNRVDKPFIQNFTFAPPLDLKPLLRGRIFAVSTGQLLKFDSLLETEANLNRIGALANYQFVLTPREDQRFDITFNSIPRSAPAGRWFARVLPYVSGLPYRTVFADFYNVDKGGLNVNTMLRYDPDKRRAFLAVAKPFRDNPHLLYRLGIDARDENWDLRNTYFGPSGGSNGAGGLNQLILREIEAGGELQFGVIAGLQWTSGLWLKRRGFSGGDRSSIFSNGWSFQMKNGIRYRLWNLPEHRFHLDTSTDLTTGRLFTGAPSRVITGQGMVSANWLPQAKDEDLVVNVRAGVGKAFASVTFDELFMLGMERDNDERLWLRGHVGTRDGRKGSAPLGTEYAILQAAVERTILKLPFVRIQAGPFFDAGRTGDPHRQFGSRGWMEDTGLKATIKTFSAVTWTVVYGRNLRDGGGVVYTAISK